MEKVLKLMVVVITIITTSNAGVIPNDLQWPIKGKGIADTSIFFNTDDAVESRKSDRHCTESGQYSKNGNHFDTHAGHDIIANVGDKVYPVYKGIVKESKGSANGGGWGARVVIEHNNNGKKWTSVYWHLQDKSLIRLGSKVNKNTIIGTIVKTTNMNDVNHLHIGLRPLEYDSKVSKDGFGDCKNLKSFVNPLDYLPHPYYYLLDDKKSTYYKPSWKESNKLDMYSGVGYKETSAYWKDSVAILYYKRSINHTDRYKIYAKFPVSSSRSNRAYYLLYVNRKLVGVKRINQSDFKNRGHNVLFFDGTFKKGDEIIIFTANGNKGKYMSSDAIIFVRQ